MKCCYSTIYILIKVPARRREVCGIEVPKFQASPNVSEFYSSVIFVGNCHHYDISTICVMRLQLPPPPQTQCLNTSVSVSHTKHCVWMSFATVLTFFQVLLLFYIWLCSYFIVLFIVYDTYVLPFDVINNNNNNNKLCAWQHNTPRPSPPPVGAQAPRRPAEQTQRSSTFPPVGFPRRIRSHADRCSPR